MEFDLSKPDAATRKSKACNHLRQVLYHRIKAWDESLDAEKLLDQEIDTQADEVDNFLVSLNMAEDALSLSDEDVLAAFDVIDPDENETEDDVNEYDVP